MGPARSVVEPIGAVSAKLPLNGAIRLRLERMASGRSRQGAGNKGKLVIT